MAKLVKYFFLIGLLIGTIFLLNGTMETEQGDPNAVTVAFYNVENLFDTINDPESNDDKFLPTSKARWTSEKYRHKVNNLSKVIEQLGDANGPEILGLSEVENSAVLKELVKNEKLKAKNYQIIQFDSKDKRGIDVALLYKKNKFVPLSSVAKTFHSETNKNFKTRDVLLVSGKIGKDTIYLLLNHWPSRLGGQEKSETHRLMIAHFTRSIIDSLFKVSAHANIIVMGDFNDEPFNKSIAEVLNAKGDKSECSSGKLFNPFYQLMKEDKGTIKFEGQWDLFDQIMISKNLLVGNGIIYQCNSANIYNPVWMYYKEDTRHGPFRTYMGTKYYGGYSDHFPVYIQLVEHK